MTDTERRATVQAHLGAAWNAAHPVGTPIRFWPGDREGAGRSSWTRSEAWLLGGHTAVVMVRGHSGCVALTHVEAVEADRICASAVLVLPEMLRALQEIAAMEWLPIGDQQDEMGARLRAARLAAAALAKVAEGAGGG